MEKLYNGNRQMEGEEKRKEGWIFAMTFWQSIV
jgi:hypothetical protein